MSEVKRCAACGKENPVSEMKVCMHHQMHRYVCDSKCMTDFYNPPKKLTGAELAASIAELEAELAQLRAGQEPVALSVWYGPMPESNGKQNYTALLHRKGESLFDGVVITLDRSEYPDRVRYEADRVRHLIGELAEEPCITDYDADAHSGYVAPPKVQQPSAVPDAVAMADVMLAWEYAEDHPHGYLRGTAKWCAAVAHSLNKQRASAPATVMGVNAQMLEALRAIKQEVYYGIKDGAAERIDAIATAAIAAARQEGGKV